MQLHRIVAIHCSAVLLHKKPAALFQTPKEHLHSGELGQTLAYHGLRHRVLCGRCEKALVYVYAPDMLEGALREPAAWRQLAKIGYPMAQGVEAVVSHLRARMRQSDGFPHEIGFLLGYPAEDVIGFMRHKGKDCKLCGLWKVYGDVARAKALFGEYQACRQAVLHHLENGGTLYTLTPEMAG